MEIVLWIAQILLGLAFILAGVNHGFRVEQIKTQAAMSWVAAVPRPMMTFIGVCEILGGLGVLLPALTGIGTWLIPVAAFGLALIMALAAVFHMRRGETQAVVSNLVLLALAVFVAFGRWMIVPL